MPPRLNPSFGFQKIPRFIPHSKPTPPDEPDTTGRVFFQIWMNPTPPDHSDRMQSPHNPSVVGSIPTGPTQRFTLLARALLPVAHPTQIASRK